MAVDFEEWSFQNDMLEVANKPCEFCQPCDLKAPSWLLVFDDHQRSPIPFDDELRAMKAFSDAESRGWNCYLFKTVRREEAMKFVKDVGRES